MIPNVAFDIDGVVAEFAKPFKKWAGKKYDLRFRETGNFHFEIIPEVPALLIDKIVAEFIAKHSRKITPRIDGLALVDYVWSKTSKPITFVTARDILTASATHYWIQVYFPAMDYVAIIVKNMGEKIKYLDNFTSFVEDRRKTAIHLAMAGKKVFMPRRPYNSLEGMPERMGGLSPGKNIIVVNTLQELTTGEYDYLLFK